MSQDVQASGEDVVGDASTEGLNRRPGPKGKAQDLSRRPGSVAVELDVFGKGELCEDEVKVVIR